MNTFLSKNRFLVWDFNQSHSQLLLRSPRDLIDKSSQNVDIIFVGVFYMRIPSLFWEIKLEDAPKKDAESVFMEIAWPSGSVHRTVGNKRIFQITTEKRVYYVGAAGWRIDKNSLRPRETSLEQFKE